MSFKYPVVMPKMSMTMETGELINFHVKVGDHVKAGDVLFEVMTDKIDMEVDAPADGVIETLVAEPGAVIEIGKPVLIMLTETQVMAFDFGGESEEPALAAPVAQVVAEIAAPVPPTPAPILNESVKAVPKARVEATKRGIDLRAIAATGPDNTITMHDLNNAQVDPAVAKRQKANRALIAKGIELTRAIPQASFSRSTSANFDKPSLIAAWATVLRARPDLAIHSHIGVAVIIESKYGSALPVFKDPDQLALGELKTLVETTSQAAKNGKVPLAMLTGATTTIFDVTAYSMNSSTPLLFPNQVTSLTIGHAGTSEKNISLTIDLNFCDFYDGAMLLDALVASLTKL
jgi:pyruvate dehydrogenase E2 component (dihydrolipoamide acetyltransferase)